MFNNIKNYRCIICLCVLIMSDRTCPLRCSVSVFPLPDHHFCQRRLIPRHLLAHCRQLWYSSLIIRALHPSSTQDTPMRFGLYAEMQTPLDKPHAQLYRELLRQMEHADQVGFDVYSVIEHHFFQEFSISANPLALICAAAQRTRRLRFRVALHTLPLANPMRLAGEIAAADILTEGRLETGLGRGHAWLFERSGVDLAESRGRYEEAVEILLRAWAEDNFSFAGRYYNFKDLTVVPKPLQRPHPPLFAGGTSLSTYESAGQRGWG